MQKWLYSTTSLFSIVLLVIYHQLNELPVDTGDGLAHYFIANNSFSQPSDFLDHWGKPIFTMLSAPFAYFGFHVYVFFNILVFALSLFVAHKIFKHFQTKTLATALFPLILLGSLDYTSNVLGGMTEVLFGFLALLSGFLALKKRWFWFALLIAIMPYVRSEGQFLLPIALIILTLNRAIQYAVLFIIVFVFFGNVGWIAHEDFWWYFTQNPYKDASDIYGHGAWYHYIVNWHLHLGLPGLILLIFGLVLYIKNVFTRENNSENRFISLYFGTIYFGIIIVHSYLWANGKNGALGLSRLAIHGLPGLVLISILALNSLRVKAWMNYLIAGFLALISLLCIRDYPFVHDQAFPKKAMPDERAVIDASLATLDYLKNNPAGKVYYYHPLVAYKTNVNLKDQKGRFIQKSFGAFDDEMVQLNTGDLIIWDSHFAKRDMNFPEEETSRFEELFIFTPFNQMVHKGEAVSKVKVLRVNKSQQTNNLKLQSIVDSTLSISSDSLYTDLPRLKKTGTETRTYQLSIIKRQSNEGQLYFVIQHNATGLALTFELDNENAWKFSLPSDLSGEFKVFVHNPNGVVGEIVVRMQMWIPTIK